MRAESIEPTEAGLRILRRMHPSGGTIPALQAMDDVARARLLGDRVRLAIEEATANGVTSWALVGAILLAKEP